MSRRGAVDRSVVRFALAGLCSVASVATRSLPYVSVLLLLAFLVLLSRAFARLPTHKQSGGLESESDTETKHLVPLVVLPPVAVAGLGLMGAGSVMALAGIANWHDNLAQGISFATVGLLLALCGMWLELGAFVGLMEALDRDGRWTKRAKRLGRGMIQAIVPWKKLD